jgi:molecular chaperone DnaK (HSP70)
MRVGIDFGTTNSGIAIYDGAEMHLFKVDELLPDLLPSIIYITKQFAEYVGSEARDLYLQQNVNRPSRFEKIGSFGSQGVDTIYGGQAKSE